MADSSGGSPLPADALRALIDLVREDWRTHGRSLSSPGFQALTVQRFGAWRREVPLPWRRFLSVVYLILNGLVRNLYGIELSDRTTFGRRVWIAHHAGVVIDDRAVLGDDVMIRQNVTIALGDSRTSMAAPTIGHRVRIGAGAVIVGGVSVGDDAVIGPNTVVVIDVAPGSTVFAPPSRQMKPSNARAEP